jgi:hypothetical protein
MPIPNTVRRSPVTQLYNNSIWFDGLDLVEKDVVNASDNAVITGKDGKTYTFGGVNFGSGTYRKGVYSIEGTNTPNKLSDMAYARALHCAIEDNNGNIYVIAGSSFGTAPFPLPIEKFNIASNTWTTVSGNFAVSRTDNDAQNPLQIWFDNGLIYITGGYGGRNYPNEVLTDNGANYPKKIETWNPITNVWTYDGKVRNFGQSATPGSDGTDSGSGTGGNTTPTTTSSVTSYSKGSRKRLSMGLAIVNNSTVAPFFVFNTTTPLADENISCDRVDVFIPKYEKSSGNVVDTINYYVRSYGFNDSGLTSSENYVKITSATQTVLTNFKSSIPGSTEVSTIDIASSKKVTVNADAKNINNIKTTIVKQGSTTKYEIYDVVDLPYQSVRFTKATASGIVVSCDPSTLTDANQLIVVAYYFNYSNNSVTTIFYLPGLYQDPQSTYTDTVAKIFPFNGKTSVTLTDDKLNLGQSTSGRLLGFLYQGWGTGSVSPDASTPITGQVAVGTLNPIDINPIFNKTGTPTTGGGTVTTNPVVPVTPTDTIDPNSVAAATFTFSNSDITDFFTLTMKAMQSLSPRKAISVSDNYTLNF